MTRMPMQASTSAAAPEAAAGADDEQAKLAAQEEVDSRSIFIGQVDYSATPEELQILFQVICICGCHAWASAIVNKNLITFLQHCGTVNRVTIKSDKEGNPKVRMMFSTSRLASIKPKNLDAFRALHTLSLQRWTQ